MRSYDRANRLASVVRYDTDGTTLLAKTEFKYDGLSRKSISREYDWADGAWELQSEVRRI